MSNIQLKHIPLIIILYLTFIYFGLVENLKSIVFPLIKDAFNESYDKLGLLVSVSWFGYVLFSIVATFCLARYPTKWCFIFGYLLVIVGSLLTLVIPNFALSVVIMTIIWMGFGFFELSGNTLATTLFTSSSAIWLNLLHFFYGVGAVLGPYYASWMVSLLDMSYKSPYIPVAIAVFITLIVIFFIKFDVKSISENEKSTMTIKDALSNWLVWYSAISLGFMEVIEFGACNWGGLYYRDVYGLDLQTDGATFVSMFYIFFTITRLVSGFWIEKLGYLNSIIFSLVMCVIIYLIGFLMGANGRWLIPLTGFFIGILFPTYMCVGMEMFKDDGSMATNVMIVLSGATNGIMQYLIGIINEFIGNEWGFRCNVLYTAIPLITMTILKIIIIHKKKANKDIYEPKKKEQKDIELGEVKKEEKGEDKPGTEQAVVEGKLDTEQAVVEDKPDTEQEEKSKDEVAEQKPSEKQTQQQMESAEQKTDVQVSSN